jgi:Nif-specific regulatory protein
MTPPKSADSPVSSSFPQLICLAGRQVGKVFPLTGRQVTLGRLLANDICARSRHVSRRHAQILRKDDGYWVVDLKSRNGTLVNDTAVQRHLLQHGDEITIGDHCYVFMTKPHEARPVPDKEVRILPDLERGRTITLKASVLREEILFSTDEDRMDPDLRSRLLRSVDVLQHMAQLMVADIDRPDLLQKISSIMVRCFNAERAYVLLPDGGSEQFVAAAASFRQGRKPGDLPLSKTIIERVATEKTSLLCEDATSDARFGRARSVSRLNILSVMCTPLIHRDTLLGLLYLDNRSSTEEFSKEDLHLLQTMANQVAVLIQNFNLLSGMKHRLRHLEEQVEQGEQTIVGNSPAISEVVATARKAADSNATILILGESGTGKEVLAKSIHRWSQRSTKPFVVVNCAALSDQLLQSDLFGHEQGAFTGAIRQKKGRLELANSGTVFLDEIGEIEPETQAKLLRFLQEREFERVGGTRSIKVDVRIIAASNRNLSTEVQAGRFREDLYHRLRVIEVSMPPLRKRRGDIPMLAEKFLLDCSKETGREFQGFSQGAMDLLKGHHWPGNVRELRNAIERAVVLSSSDRIEATDFSLSHSERVLRLDEELTGFHDQVRELKRQVIRDALERTGGMKTLAAERLGLQPTYLSRLMKNLGMR